MYADRQQTATRQRLYRSRSPLRPGRGGKTSCSTGAAAVRARGSPTLRGQGDHVGLGQSSVKVDLNIALTGNGLTLARTADRLGFFIPTANGGAIPIAVIGRD
jgi:hypothetical protein